MWLARQGAMERRGRTAAATMSHAPASQPAFTYRAPSITQRASAPVQRICEACDSTSPRDTEDAPTSDVLQRNKHGSGPDMHPLRQQSTGHDASGIHQIADRGLSGGAGALPHFETIQGAFGPDHDLSGVRAHVGGAATAAAVELGAIAYTKGEQIAFSKAPSLHTAAHEAAHIVQQRAGVHVKGGVGEEGDSYERHADAVAGAVSRGESARSLLAGFPAGATTVGSRMVQRQPGVDDPGLDDGEISDDQPPVHSLTTDGKKYCDEDYKYLGQFLITAYVLAQESEFSPTPTVKDPCGLTGTFRRDFLFRTGSSPRGVKMQGSGKAMNGDVIHYKADDCFEVLDCAKTASGTCATSGRTVAVDRKLIKLGSKIDIEDVGYRSAEDTGGGIAGAHIDVYFGTDKTIADASKFKLTNRAVCRKKVKKP
jgi:3D (Asp-Asp-Asp) domain-containing protein